MTTPRVYIDDLERGYLYTIQQGLEWINLRSILGWGDTVFIKPNLTFPVFRKGVMTNPECVKALVFALKDYTDRIIVGEADSGGYNRFSIDEVLVRTGIKELEKAQGIRVVNLSHHPYRFIEFSYRGRLLRVPLPIMLLEEVDYFITVPVPKIHMNTYVSLAVKNQWGCIPEPSIRLRLHPYFAPVVYEVNRNIQTSLAIVDGKYGLNRSGPMRGEVVDLNWLMIADNIYAADLVCCHLMQVDPRRVYYLRYLENEAKVLPRIEAIKFYQDYTRFSKTKFYLERVWTDYLSVLAFKSPLISYLAYHSALAGALHKLLYLFREPFYDYDDPAKTDQMVDVEARRDCCKEHSS